MGWIARNTFVGVLASIAAMTVTAGWEQTELEEILCHGCEPRDYFPEGKPPYVPHRALLSSFHLISQAQVQPYLQHRLR